jgi:tRNA U34 5-methylaminomethyl-2-thiouridine-forming methyltransferase MnmC
MIWPVCAADGAQALHRRLGRDGSYSLWSPRFEEGFHCADGALGEAQLVFVAPAQLERFTPGNPLTVVEVAVGTGTNTAALIEAMDRRGLELRWWGLESDPAPLELALADEQFQAQWSPAVVRHLAELGRSDRMLWGDARARLPELAMRLEGRCDLLLLDAFSPRRCPELWSLEFLHQLARLLAPSGRLLTYCSAAAVRRALELAGLKLAAITRPDQNFRNAQASASPADIPSPAQAGGNRWSAGTAASPATIPTDISSMTPLRPLSPMEREHMLSTAGETYRDPGGTATAEQMLAARARAQASSGAESSSAWQRRWGIERR